MSAPCERVRSAIEARTGTGRVALIPFITAGYPDPARFVDDLRRIATEATVIEIGVPFSNPMADGPTIQRASRAAIESGVSLRWILRQLAESGGIEVPLVLMSYLNPLFAYGYDALARDAAAAGIGGLIVPDLPWEEGEHLFRHLERRGIAWIPLVTPATTDERITTLCTEGRGFVYAVTVRGTTGGDAVLPSTLGDYLRRVRAHSRGLPVCAGFGIRDPAQVRAIGRFADGVIVGSALVEAIEAGRAPDEFLRSLNPR